MRSNQGQTPDWRDAEAYAPLLQVGRPGFAWEWLRRNDSYREAAERALQAKVSGRAGLIAGAQEGAEQWGLHAFEAPERDAIAARPVWRRDMLSYVLEADAVDEGEGEDRFDIARLRHLATLIKDGAAERLLLSDGRRALRVDVVSGTLGSGPVLLRYRLAGMSRLEAPLLVLRQVLALWRTGQFSRVLHRPEQRAMRWIMLLRTHDALAAGASQRDIAVALLGREAADRRWRVEASSLRSRAQRLVRDARRMAGGYYLTLLGGA